MLFFLFVQTLVYIYNQPSTNQAPYSESFSALVFDKRRRGAVAGASWLAIGEHLLDVSLNGIKSLLWFSRARDFYPHRLVLVGSRNRFERDLHKLNISLFFHNQATLNLHKLWSVWTLKKWLQQKSMNETYFYNFIVIKSTVLQTSFLRMWSFLL